jgi:alpha-mannosidase
MSTKKYHLAYITASHLDLFWLGHLFSCLERGTEVVRQYVDDLLAHPERTYFIETAIFAEELVRKHPDYREKMKQLLREGRLEIGAAFVDRKENATGGESLIRHCTIGKRLLRELFDYDSPVAMHPDLPGYTPQLPQIYSKSGIKYYLTSRKVFPNGQVFRFQAPDGSVTLHCHFAGGSYWHIPVRRLMDRLSDCAAGFPAGRLVVPGGVGDLGGRDTYVQQRGAQLEDLIAQGRQEYPSLTLSYATLQSIMDDYEDGAHGVPVRSGEVPCMWGSTPSIHVEPWDANRRAEGELLDAEMLGALARVLLGANPIPPERGRWSGWRYDPAFWLPDHPIEKGREFEELWKLVLVPQDHNNGSREGPETTFQKTELSTRASAYARPIKQRCLRKLAGRTATNRKGADIVVFNQASWDRTDVVQLSAPGRRATRVLDHRGQEVPSQVVNTPDGARLCFIAKEVPAIGYRVFRVERGAPETARLDRPIASGDPVTVGGGRVRVTFDGSTGAATQFALPGLQFSLLPPGSGWGRLRALTEEPESLDVCPRIDSTVPPEEMEVERRTVVSSGPLFTEVAIAGQLCQSWAEQSWRVYHDMPRVDLGVRLLWWGKLQMQLRLALPFPSDFDGITYETPFFANQWPRVMEGAAPWHNDEVQQEDFERYREALTWLDLSNGKVGVTVASRHSTYRIDGPHLEAVLLRSPRNCGDRRRHTLNAGDRRWTFSFTFHRRDWRAAAGYRKGFEITRPLVTVSGAAGKSPSPAEASFLSLEPRNVMVTAVKLPDRGAPNELIVRLCEMAGKSCIARLTFPRGVRRACETDLSEADRRTLCSRLSKSLTVRVKAHEIKTLRLVL